MRRNAGTILLAIAVGYTLAHFATAFYGHWYFADLFWLKVGIVTGMIAIAYGLALTTSWNVVWRVIGCWWIVTHLLAMIPAGGPDLRNMAFVAVLDFEVAVVWGPGALLLAFALYHYLGAKRKIRQASNRVESEMRMRSRLRRYASRTIPRSAAVEVGDAGHVD